MDTLIEKLITNLDGSEIEGLGSFDKTDDQAIESLVNNNRVFNQEAIKYIKPLVIDSIKSFGVDTARNKWLPFVTNKDLTTAVPLEHGRMLHNEFQNGDLRVPAGLKKIAAAKWLIDPRTYKGDIYKLQALLLLSDVEEAKTFGDLETRPFEEILEASTRDQVEKILDKWQTKSGEETYSRGRGYRKGSRGSSGKKVPKSQKDWVEQVTDLISKASKDDVAKAAAKAHKEGRSVEDALYATVQELAASAEKSGGDSSGAGDTKS